MKQLKLARKATGKQGIITFQQSFHGRTFGAMAATGQDKIKEGFGDGVPHFSYAVYNDLASVEDLVNQDTAAVMLELVQGESGVHPAEVAFVKDLADFCQREGLLLIVDEVQTGMGRTGQLYSFEHYGIVPDIVTLAKSGQWPACWRPIGKIQLGSRFWTWQSWFYLWWQ